jgi:hypothetical protein
LWGATTSQNKQTKKVTDYLKQNHHGIMGHGQGQGTTKEKTERNEKEGEGEGSVSFVL